LNPESSLDKPLLHVFASDIFNLDIFDLDKGPEATNGRWDGATWNAQSAPFQQAMSLAATLRLASRAPNAAHEERFNGLTDDGGPICRNESARLYQRFAQ
jgi:hypothetical protein